VDRLAFEHHLTSPQGLRRFPANGDTVTAEGGACCDTLRFGVTIDGEHVTGAGFEAQGCGAATAAGSAAVALSRGRPLLEAARIGPAQIAAELGGLSPGKLHAAELAADALARALGAAAAREGRLSQPANGPRTLVAMSGGVDSAVAALLCAEHDQAPPIAVTLELFSDHENDAERSCCSASAVSQARALAHSLGLPHFTLDLRDAFGAGVVQPFIDGYAQGETPNPCIGCNGHVRLDAMLTLADRLGCDTLATGHYARVAEDDDPRGPLLRAAADPAKDQTYMLAALSPHSLRRMRFPLGQVSKVQVRERAAQAGLPVAAKPESQDLCFLAGTSRARFLARHGNIAERPGAIVDRNGSQLGRHRGQHLYTVGQRRGLRIPSQAPLYVLDKDAATNQLTVGPRSALRTSTVAIRDVTLRRDSGRVNRVKLRYRSKPLAVRVSDNLAPGHHRQLILELGEPADGAAPGQLACLLDGELVVGWGTITRPR